MCTGKCSLDVFAVAPVDRDALPHSVQKVNTQTLVIHKIYALTLCVRKA